MNFGEDLSLQLMLANKSYHQYLFNVLKEIDVYQHYQIILLLSRCGGRTTQKNICDALQIEKSHMVAIITLLEDKGYVTKQVNFKDRRSKLISVTPKANEVMETISQSFAAFEDEIADELTWQEMYNCLRVLNKVNDKLKNISFAANAVKPLNKCVGFVNTVQADSQIINIGGRGATITDCENEPLITASTETYNGMVTVKNR